MITRRKHLSIGHCCTRTWTVLRLGDRGAIHFGILIILAMVAAAFVYAGKWNSKITVKGSAKERRESFISPWRTEKKVNVNGAGIEFSADQPPTENERAQKYYPDSSWGRP